MRSDQIHWNADLPMTAKLNLRQTIVDFLKARPEERFTARQIALWIFENLREACEVKRHNSHQDLREDTIFSTN